jgi:hypothetical protein
MAGYVRQDTTGNISTGNIIEADDLNAEFNAVVGAFNAASGHKHDGTSAEGAPIEVVGPAQDVVITTSVMRPKTDNTIDLGTSTQKYKDLHSSGTAFLAAVSASGNATVGGTLSVTGLITASGGVSGNVTGDLTGNVTGDLTGNVTGDLTGNVTGDLTGNVTGDLTGNVTGDLTGNVTGDLTGNVTGDLTGNVTGDLTGNVTGDLTGNVTGDLTGNADTATALETARNFTIGATARSFNGTANVTWSLSDIGVGTLGQQNSNSVTITGGTINGTSIGATTPSTGAFTSITGTAVTQSSTDTTAGRLLKVGDFGIGDNQSHLGLAYISLDLPRVRDSFLLLGEWDDAEFSIAGAFIGRRNSSFAEGQRGGILDVYSFGSSGKRNAGSFYRGTGTATAPVLLKVTHNGIDYLALFGGSSTSAFQTDLSFMGYVKNLVGVTVDNTGQATESISSASTDTPRLYANDRLSIYHQGDILGTVSQSSGVPTGAIIQRGSNANGEFVRYADGTQICRIHFTEDRSDIGDLVSTLTYPAAFADIPTGPSFGVDRAAISCIARSGAGSGTSIDWRVNNVGTTSFDLRVNRNTSTNTALLITASGRWY